MRLFRRDAPAPAGDCARRAFGGVQRLRGASSRRGGRHGVSGCGSGGRSPAELLTRILHQAPRGAQKSEERAPWWRRLFGGWVENVLQPRYAMGMAMTVLSLAMLARFAHIEPRPLRASDLDPARVWQSIDDHSHRVWDRTMKYYDNLRLVIEIQSRLKDWSDQEQTAGVGGTASQESTSGTAPARTPRQTPVQTNDRGKRE